MPAAYALELRERAVAHYKETDSTQTEIANTFNIGIATLRRYLRREEAGELRPIDYTRGRQPVISGSHLNKIEEWVNDKPDIKLKQLCKKYKSYYKVKVSYSMMFRALSTLDITRKKKSLFAEEQLRDDVKKRANHIGKYSDVDPKHLIFIDEMGAHLNMALDYARAKSGKRISMPKPFIRGSKISLIGAISTTGVEAALYGEWATDANIFYHFIQHDLCPTLTKDNIVLLDNVSFHKDARIEEGILATGAKLDFLPPYSPEYNPIKMVWSFVKNILREMEARTVKAFQKALKFALGEITQENLIGWYNHTGYRST